MSSRLGIASAAFCGFLAMTLSTSAQAGDLSATLKKGKPDIKSAGSLAFGPNGVLFVADTQGGALFAFDTGDKVSKIRARGVEPIQVKDVAKAAADMLGTKAQGITINDVAVNPASGRAYLSITRGQGAEALPAILSVGPDGKLRELSLDDAKFAKAVLPSPPKSTAKSQRADAITDIAFIEGRVFVAGLSNEEFSSRLVAIPFPFEDISEGAGVEIYHGAHGRFETNSPVRTFVAYPMKDQTYLLAAYTCTPLVKIPISDLKPGARVKGKTIAELGNRNRPIDMIVYKKGGKDFLLMANSSRGVMKIPTEGADTADSITSRVADKKGMPYETIAALKDVTQLDKLDSGHALILFRSAAGTLDLETIELP